MATTVENQDAHHDWLVCAHCGAAGDRVVDSAGLHRLAAVVYRGTLVIGGSGGTAACGEQGGAAEIGCTLVGQKYGRGFLRSRALSRGGL